MRRQSNPIMPHETWLELFSSNFKIELRIFCGLYFDSVLSPVFKYKALVGVLSSSNWLLYQGRIFLAAFGAKKTLPSCTTIFIFIFFHCVRKLCNDSFVHLNSTVEGPGPKHLETELTNITRRHFCSSPVFCIKHSFYTQMYLLYLLSFIGIFFRYLLVLTYFKSPLRHTHATTNATGTQIVRAKITSLDAIFSSGNKSSSVTCGCHP